MISSKNRHNSWRKAIRKRNIDRNVHQGGGDWYSNLHQYSKGKIHCSCKLCSAKTRKNGHTISDIRKIQRLEYASKEPLERDKFRY